MAAKILIVDDEQSLRELLEAIVSELGYEVLTASNGKQALELIAHTRPTLVISDVMMPVMDGYRLLENIKSHASWHNIKILLVSAVQINKQVPYQADGYIAKPYDLDVLEEVIERLVNIEDTVSDSDDGNQTQKISFL